MRLVALLILLAGCPAGGDDQYPITTGGDDHPINPMVDAAPSDGTISDGTILSGRVCLITDLRFPTSGCALTGAAGIVVKLGTSMTMTTGADGSFTIAPAAGTGLVWHTSGTNLVPSVVPLTTSNVLPMVSEQTYLDLKSGNSVIVNTGEGSVFLYVTQGGQPLAGVTTTVTPVASYPAFGDQANASNWVQGATGAKGVSWTPGIIAGVARLHVSAPDVEDAIDVDVPIEDRAITFATLAFP